MQFGFFISSSVVLCSFVLLLNIVVLDLFNFTYLVHLINSVAHYSLLHGRLTNDYRIPTYDVISIDKYCKLLYTMDRAS